MNSISSYKAAILAFLVASESILDSYQLPAHRRLCRRAPTSTRVPSTDDTVRFAINGYFRGGVLADCKPKAVAVWAWRKMHNENA
jgi:hypothetical protein